MSLKIFSNNVKGIRGVIKRKKLFKFCSNLPCQYFCLQETHSDVTSETEWKTDWGGNIIFSHGNTNSLGVAILLKTEHKILETIIDLNGRYIIIKIKVRPIMPNSLKLTHASSLKL